MELKNNIESSVAVFMEMTEDEIRQAYEDAEAILAAEAA